MKIRNMLIFCMVWILAGCSPAGVSTPPTGTAVEPPVVDTTPLPSATTQPTHTAAPATNATPTPDPRLTYDCMDFLEGSAQNIQTDGMLIIQRRERPNPEIINLTTKTTITILNADEVYVSPDHKKLAFVQWSPLQLFVTDTNGKELGRYIAENDSEKLNETSHVVGWLDDNQILIDKADGSKYDYWSLVIYNPFSGEKTIFSPEVYPNVSPDHKLWQWNSYSLLVPDPRKTALVFPQLYDRIIMWDISSDQSMREINTYIDQRGVTPIWLMDGSAIIIRAPVSFTNPQGIYYENLPNEPSVGGEELLWVTRDGTIRRVTYLTNSFVSHPGQFSLSPDEQRIAYWLTIENNSFADERLAIVDINSGQVTNYCLEGLRFQNEGMSPAPLWSPDGRYLAITVKDRTDRFQKNSVVIDLEQKFAMEVAKDSEVLGWSITK